MEMEMPNITISTKTHCQKPKSRKVIEPTI